jgi:hypothetical protein
MLSDLLLRLPYLLLMLPYLLLMLPEDLLKLFSKVVNIWLVTEAVSTVDVA